MKQHRLLACMAALGTAVSVMAAYPTLFWDMEHISDFSGDAKLTLHHPDFREIVMVHDAPWEGNVCCYHTVLHDGDKYRMYYRGMSWGLEGYTPHEVTCYAESDDGIHWTKPPLGLCEYNGSKDNNIILMNDEACHNFTPCIDTNPACPPEQHYKALGGVSKGLYLFYSADGIHWTKAQPEPVFTKGLFDSQNGMFYDSIRQCYTCYSRLVAELNGGRKGRAIQRCISQDAIHWSEPETLDYGEDAPGMELYTNAIHPYVNNPNVLIGLPKRFKGDRASVYDLYSGGGIPGISDGVFMSSRDGLHFRRWEEAFVRPGIQHERWINRNNMSAQGVVLTKADLGGTPPVLTIYSTEGYYSNQPNRLRRLTLRQDGFVSVQAPYSGGAFTTKPIEITASDTPVRQPEELNLQIVERDGVRVLKVAEPFVHPLPVDTNLGRQVSFAITVDKTKPGGMMRRLFSSYAGGPNKAGERKFLLDMQTGGVKKEYPLIRMWYDGMEIGYFFDDCPEWKTERQGKLAIIATYDDGVMKLYVNGKLVAEGGEVGHGELITPIGPVNFGEDYPPAALSDEPYLGEVHEMAVIPRVFSAEEAAKAAAEGLKAVIAATEKGVHYDMAGMSPFRLVNRLAQEQEPIVLASKQWGELMLLLNASTSAVGDIRCEIRDEQNNPISGYTLADAIPAFGDELDLAMSWKNGADIKPLLGRKVILHFVLKDADIYSLQFGQPAP